MDHLHYSVKESSQIFTSLKSAYGTYSPWTHDQRERKVSSYE